MLGTCLWTHTTKRVSLVFHGDELLLAGTHQIVTEVLAELSRDLELAGKTKDGYNFGVDASYVESMLEEFIMSALKSALTLRWERRETDEKEMVASEQRVYRQLVGLALCNGESFIKPWTCERHGREKHQINPAIPPWKPWNHDTAADDTESGSCEKSSSELSVDVWRLRLWAGDADRFSVSGTASGLRSKLGRYPNHSVEQKTIDDRIQQW